MINYNPELCSPFAVTLHFSLPSALSKLFFHCNGRKLDMSSPPFGSIWSTSQPYSESLAFSPYFVLPIQAPHSSFLQTFGSLFGTTLAFSHIFSIFSSLKLVSFHLLSHLFALKQEKGGIAQESMANLQLCQHIQGN